MIRHRPPRDWVEETQYSWMRADRWTTDLNEALALANGGPVWVRTVWTSPSRQLMHTTAIAGMI